MAKVTIRYWAAAKEAAGVQEESVEAITLSDLLNTVVASRKPDGRLADVLARSSFLVNADPVGRTDQAVDTARRWCGGRGAAALRRRLSRPRVTTAMRVAAGRDLGSSGKPVNRILNVTCFTPVNHCELKKH